MRPREVIEHELDRLTVESARDLADMLRRIRAGTPWSDPALVLTRDRYARHRRDQATARALLAEMDALATGKHPAGGS
jgi:hypothetical protein